MQIQSSTNAATFTRDLSTTNFWWLVIALVIYFPYQVKFDDTGTVLLTVYDHTYTHTQTDTLHIPTIHTR